MLQCLLIVFYRWLHHCYEHGIIKNIASLGGGKEGEGVSIFYKNGDLFMHENI